MIHWDIVLKLSLMAGACIAVFIYLVVMAKVGTGKTEKQKRAEYDKRRGVSKDA